MKISDENYRAVFSKTDSDETQIKEEIKQISKGQHQILFSVFMLVMLCLLGCWICGGLSF